MRGGRARRAVHIDPQVRGVGDVVGSPGASERHERDAPLDQPAGAGVAVEGARDDDGVDVSPVAQIAHPPDLLLRRPRRVQHDPQAPLSRALGQGVHEPVEDDARDPARVGVEMHADGRAAARAQAARRGVGRVAQALDRVLHALSRLLADDGGRVDDVADGLP
jgi:hypothetical protein